MSSWPSRSHLRAPSARATATGNGSASRTSCVTPPGNRCRARALSAADRGFSAAQRATAPLSVPTVTEAPAAAACAVSFLTATAHPPADPSASSVRATGAGTQSWAAGQTLPGPGRPDRRHRDLPADGLRRSSPPTERTGGAQALPAGTGPTGHGGRTGPPRPRRPRARRPGPRRPAESGAPAVWDDRATQRREGPRGRPAPHGLLLPDASSGGQPVRAVTFTGAGGNEVVAVVTRPDPVPATDEVLVAARFAGVNWADLSQRQGHYPPPPGAPRDIPGLEVAGVVTAMGDAVRAWHVGDRVFGLVGGGGLADRVVVHERHVTAVPAGLADDVAAAVPEAYITAHDAVFTQCALEMGETLLVNGANGAVGSAGVRLGLAAGAQVVANVRSPDTARALAAEGALVVTPDSAAERVTDLGGADVVLELIGAPNLDFDFSALAPKGRIIIVGTTAGQEGAVSLRTLMGKRASLRGTMLRARPLEEKAAAVQAFDRSVVPLLAAGRALPDIDRVFPAAEAAAAFDYLTKPGKAGKVLLDFG